MTTAYDDIKQAMGLIRTCVGDDPSDAPINYQDTLRRANEMLASALDKLGDFDAMFPVKPGPSVLSGENLTLADAMGFSSTDAPYLQFAKDHPALLDGARIELVRASKLIYDRLGMLPYGSKKNWLKWMEELLEASQADWDSLEKGVEDARSARLDNGITLGGPQSLMNFVRNARSLKLLGPANRRIKA